MHKLIFTATLVGIFFATFFLQGGVTMAAYGDPQIYTGPGTGSQTYSQTRGFNSIQQVGVELRRFIEFGLIPLVLGLAVLAFLWGVFQFIWKGRSDEKARGEGRQFMIWGIIRLFVMVSVWGLVRILTNTLGQPLRIPSFDNLPVK